MWEVDGKIIMLYYCIMYMGALELMGMYASFPYATDPKLQVTTLQGSLLYSLHQRHLDLSPSDVLFSKEKKD